MPKNSRTACADDACAGVNTGDVPQRDGGTAGSFPGLAGLANSHAAVD